MILPWNETRRVAWVDYGEKYAPVAEVTSMRVMLATVVNDFEQHQMDLVPRPCTVALVNTSILRCLLASRPAAL